MSQLLTLAEAAQRLRKTDAQLRWMIHAGKAPKHAKIGGRILFRADDLEAFIESAFSQESA